MDRMASSLRWIVTRIRSQCHRTAFLLLARHLGVLADARRPEGTTHITGARGAVGTVRDLATLILIGVLVAACNGAPSSTAADRGALAETTAAATGPAVNLVRRYVATINAKDLEGYARLFADDAVFVDAGRRFTGADQIRRFGADLVRVGSRYVIVELTGEGNEASLVFDYTAPGVGYTLDDGRGELTADGNGLIRFLRLD